MPSHASRPPPALEKRAVLEVGNPIAKGLPMLDTLQLAAKGNMALPSNRLLTLDLLDGNWMRMAQAFPCWSGTLAAYERPNEPFGYHIEALGAGRKQKLIFWVPEEHVGKSNYLLVAEYPNIELKLQDGALHIHAKKCFAIPNFPAEDGTYKLDPEFMIPSGNRSERRDPAAGYLWRKREGWAGLISRNLFFEDLDFCRIVDMTRKASEKLGLIRIASGSGEVIAVDPQELDHNGGPYRGHCMPTGSKPRETAPDGAKAGILDSVKRFLGMPPTPATC